MPSFSESTNKFILVPTSIFYSSLSNRLHSCFVCSEYMYLRTFLRFKCWTLTRISLQKQSIICFKIICIVKSEHFPICIPSTHNSMYNSMYLENIHCTIQGLLSSNGLHNQLDHPILQNLHKTSTGITASPSKKLHNLTFTLCP